MSPSERRKESEFEAGIDEVGAALHVREGNSAAVAREAGAKRD
jgi:hypothetical protein